jgi:hypothetical protein
MWSYSNAIGDSLLAFLKTSWDGKTNLDLRSPRVNGLGDGEIVDNIQVRPLYSELCADLRNEPLGVSSTLYFDIRGSVDSMQLVLMHYTGFFDRDMSDPDEPFSEPASSKETVWSPMTYDSTKQFFNANGSMNCVACGESMGRPNYAGYAQGMLARKGRPDKLDALPVCYACYDDLVDKNAVDIAFEDGARLTRIGCHNCETHY